MHTKGQVGPMFIDEAGRGKATTEVMGIPSCGWDANDCFTQMSLDKWASAIRDNELPFSLRFSWATVATGSAINLRFTLLQALQDAGGGRPTFSAVPVSFVRVPIDK